MLICPRCFNAYLSADRCRIDNTRLLRPDAVRTDQHVGTRSVGRFELGEELALGRSSRVFRALDKRTRKHVAVKIFHGELAQDRKLAARLAVAAKQQAKLDHKRFVRVIDADLTEHGLAYVARELAGVSLASSLRTQGARTPRSVAMIVQEIALALSKLHWGGQVHDDLRPGAVMLSGERGREEVRLLEPGSLAILKAASPEVLDVLGGSLVAPAYLSPEAAAGEKTTTLSDLYVLGVILYELLIGWPPFSEARAHIEQPAPAIALDFCGLAELARSLLEKDPAKRPQAAQAVLARIERLGISEPPHRREQGSGSTGDLPAAPKRSRAPAFFAIGAAAGAVAIAPYLYSMRGEVVKLFGERPAIAEVAPPPAPIPQVIIEEPQIAEVAPAKVEPVVAAAVPVQKVEPAAPADPVREAYAAMDLEIARMLAERGLSFNDLASVAWNPTRQWGRWFKKEPIPSLEAVQATFDELKSAIDRATKVKTSTPAGT